MKLYERQVSKLLVYDLSASKDKLKDYRLKEIKKQGLVNSFYSLEFTNKSILDKLLNKGCVDISLLDEDITASSTYFLLEKKLSNFVSDSIIQEKIVERYAEGLFFNKPIVRGCDSVGRCFYNFLQVSNAVTGHSIKDNRDYYLIREMLNLPYSLMGLELLERGEFDKLLNSATFDNTPFHLYDLNLVGEYNGELLNLDLMSDVNRRITTTEKIIKKYRKVK